jgi:hypothetical protein
MPLSKSVEHNLARPRRYAVARVEKTDAPDGSNGRWYRYVLDNGSSTITGVRCGSVQDVTRYANDYVEQLNTRNLTGKTSWTPRGRKPAAR